jgi:hypothetical protein
MEDGAQFCPSCGQAVTAGAGPQKQEGAVGESQTPEWSKKEQHKSAKGSIIWILICLGLGVIVFVFALKMYL